MQIPHRTALTLALALGVTLAAGGAVDPHWGGGRLPGMGAPALAEGRARGDGAGW